MNQLAEGLDPENRSLAKHERELVEWLLEHSEIEKEEAFELKAQIDRLTVVSKCNCGCPTIYFALDGVPVKRKGESLVSDHPAVSDGQDVGVMLFQTDRKLSSLEVYSLAGHDKPFPLPQMETVYSYDGLANPKAETPDTEAT